MDLYSSLRIVRRWWYLAVPLLLLTVGGALVAVGEVSASKQASGEVVVLAAPSPPAATNDNPNPPEANNPYALMALPDVVDVLSRTVSSDATGRVLEHRGLQGTYTVQGNQNFQRGPIITIETTAPDERSALRSYRLVASEVASTLDGLQDQVGANPAFRVKMQRLTPPQVAATSTLTDLRAALIAVAIGLLLTLTVVFGAESISRGRARRAARRTTADAATDSVLWNSERAPVALVESAATSEDLPPGGPGEPDEAFDSAQPVEMADLAEVPMPRNGAASEKTNNSNQTERGSSETTRSASDGSGGEGTGTTSSEIETSVVPSEES